MLTPIRKTGCILILLFSACILSAQGERGTISGTVHDATGAVVAGAAVTVTNVNTGVPVTVVTNQAGEYVAPNLIPGDYSVTVKQPGFNTITQTGIVLHIGERVAVDI